MQRLPRDPRSLSAPPCRSRYSGDLFPPSRQTLAAIAAPTQARGSYTSIRYMVLPMDAKTRMPAAFIGHGSPMNAIERNRYTEAWRTFGAAAPRPRAILMVSAHWYVPVLAVTAMLRPKTIHD